MKTENKWMKELADKLGLHWRQVLKQIIILTYLGSNSGNVLHTMGEMGVSLIKDMDDLELKTGGALFRVHPPD